MKVFEFMDPEEIRLKIVVGLNHEAIVNREAVPSLPGLLQEVRIVQDSVVWYELNDPTSDHGWPKWKAECDSIDEAIQLVEDVLQKPVDTWVLQEPPIETPSVGQLDQMDVFTAIATGKFELPQPFKLVNWTLMSGSHTVTLAQRK